LAFYSFLNKPPEIYLVEKEKAECKERERISQQHLVTEGGRRGLLASYAYPSINTST
jgi:hypothetical protein